MAITARFVADFESFYAAVKKAEVELRGIETGANKVSQSLNRMADSFSGRRIIQDANLTAEAIDRIGGVSKLTEAEQARVNRTVTEAIAKYKALGQEAPQALKLLADQTRTVATRTEGWSSQAKNLAGSLGLVFSAGALVGFARDILAMGDDIQRTADRTGLMTDEVQRLSFIAGQSGNTLEELTGAIGQMQNRLASGDESAVGALKALNVSFDDLAKLGPYQQLQLIADAVSKIPNPANQAQVAMDLFGRTGIAILPTLKSQFLELGNAAPVMSDKTIKALDAAGDSIDRFKLTLKVFAAEAYNYLGKVFDQGVAAVYRYLGSLYDAVAGLEKTLSKLPGATKVFPTLAADMKGAADQAQWFRDAAAAMTREVVASDGAVQRAIPPLERHAATTKAAGTAQREHTAAVRESVPVSAEAARVLQLLEAAHRHESAALDMEAAAYKASQRAAENYIKSLPTGKVTLLDGVRDLSGIVPQIDALGVSVHGVTHEFQESGKESKNWTASIKGALTSIGGEVASAFAGGGSFVSKLKAFGTNVAKDFTSGLLSAIPGIGPALAQFAGPLVDGVKALFGKVFGTAGRDAVKDFAATFTGGFDGPGGLHEALNTLGAEGETLWKKLTQGVGRNNPEQAAAVIKEITAALEAQKDKQKEVEKAAVQSSAAQIAAQESAKAAVASLDAQIKSLSDSIAGEAPEEFMGIVEQETRARIAGLTKEREAAQQSLETLSGTMTDSIDRVTKAISELPKSIALELDVKFRGGEVPEGAATGGIVGQSRVLPFASGGWVPRGTDTVPAVLTPGEIVLNAAQQRRVSGALTNGDGSGDLAALRRDLKEQRLRADVDRHFILVQLPKAIVAAMQKGAAA